MASPSVVGDDREADRPEAGGMLHDLSQPLAAIRALASIPLPADRASAAEEAAGRLKQIEGLAGWMAALLREATAAAGQQPGAPADAAAVALEVVVSAAAAFRGVLRCHRSPPAPVPLDPLDLRRAVGNVVDNATRAAGPRGRVEVRVRRLRGRVWIEVADDGPGFGMIPRQTGRGLTIALDVAGSCNGVVEILESPAGGALVRLGLPLEVPGRRV